MAVHDVINAFQDILATRIVCHVTAPVVEVFPQYAIQQAVAHVYLTLAVGNVHHVKQVIISILNV